MVLSSIHYYFLSAMPLLQAWEHSS